MPRKVASRMRSRTSRSMGSAEVVEAGSDRARAAAPVEEPHALGRRPHLSDPVDGRAGRAPSPWRARSAACSGRRGEQELVVLAAAQRPAQGDPRPGRRPPARVASLTGRASTSTRAPTRLSAAMCPRSVARPSERSIIAVAQPEARMTRALGDPGGRAPGAGRTTASTTAGGNSPAPRSSTARPAAAAPEACPVTRIASPGRAPLRRRGAPIHAPDEGHREDHAVRARRRCRRRRGPRHAGGPCPGSPRRARRRRPRRGSGEARARAGRSGARRPWPRCRRR